MNPPMPHQILRILFFLSGALALSGICLVQDLLFKGNVPPEAFAAPFLLGGFTGLFLCGRTLQVRSLNSSLLASNNRLQQLLEESENRYRHLFHLNQMAQLLIDPETGEIVESNEAADRFYGYPEGNLCGKSIAELDTDPLQTTLDNMRSALIQQQLSFRLHHRLHCGEIRPVAVYTVPLERKGRRLLHFLIIDTSEEQQAESSLRRKTREQRLLLDAIPICIWYLSDPETYGMVNMAYADRFDLHPSDIARKNIRDVVSRDAIGLALASNRQVFVEKKPLQYEQWMHFGRSEPQYMAISKTPKLDDHGQVEFVVCTGTDITRLQMARELLRIERDLHLALGRTGEESDTLRVCLDKAMEASQGDGGAIYQPHRKESGLVLAVARGLSTPLVEIAARLSPQSALMRQLEQHKPLYPEPDDPLLEDLAPRLAIDGIRSVALVPIAPQDRLIALLLVTVKKKESISAYNRQVLERVATYIGTFLVQQEQSALLLQHQQNLESLFQTIRDMVFIFDSQGTIILCNAAATRRLGYRREEIAGRNICDLFSPEHRQEITSTLGSLLSGEQRTSSFPLSTKDGERIPVETHITPGQWSGRPVFFGLSRDISARLQIERQQRQLLKNEGLQRMAGAMAHHFNNLMTIVTGNLELASEAMDFDADSQRLISHALIGSKRASELGQALLIYTGQFAEKSQQINLSDFCRSWLALGRFAPAENITLKVDLTEPGPIVHADPDLLEQTLVALVTNATESIGFHAGRISLTVRSLAGGELRWNNAFPVNWNPTEDRYGSLEIADTGSGIEEGRIASIFDPFYSEKFVGRGLGLPLALSIVKRMGGAITVESRPREGSIFQVLIPEVVLSWP